LFSSSTLHVFVITGLPASPAVRELNAAFLNELPQAAAISDDGAWLAAAYPAGIFAFGPSGEVVPLAVAGEARALAFYPGSTTLAAVTESQLWRIEDVGGANRATPLASFAHDDRGERARRRDPTVSSPVALAISGDSAHAIVALDDGNLLNYSLKGSVDPGAGAPSLQTPSLRSLNCHCHPEGLFAMAGMPADERGARLASTGPQVFRLTGLTAAGGTDDPEPGGAFLLYDAGSNRILYVPAGVPAADGQAGGNQ
jgi:hypothetical protein